MLICYHGDKIKSIVGITIVYTPINFLSTTNIQIQDLMCYNVISLKIDNLKNPYF